MDQLLNFGYCSTHLAILLNGPPKPEACWRGRRLELCDELMLTVGV